MVNYQLHQLRLNNLPGLFAMINTVFSKLEKDLSVLDIGCTSGYYYEILEHYYPNKFKYSACDYNTESIELTKQYYPNIDFMVEDITKLTYSNKSFDVTFLSGVIEHVPNYKKGLEELYRVTKKYIILHRIWFLHDRQTISKKGTQYFVPVIRNQYNKNDFFKILENNDFKSYMEIGYI